MFVCYECGFWDSDYQDCMCPSHCMWYACPIESSKPENQKALKDLEFDVDPDNIVIEGDNNE